MWRDWHRLARDPVAGDVIPRIESISSAAARAIVRRTAGRFRCDPAPYDDARGLAVRTVRVGARVPQ
jgi:hypothetical protein